MPANVPLWALILEAASNDPLRAMEIEQSVSAEWWMRYLAYRKAESEAAKHKVE